MTNSISSAPSKDNILTGVALMLGFCFTAPLLNVGATLAPLQYFGLPVATLVGYLVFNDFPDALSLMGIAIIIGAGLYMIHRERITIRQSITAGAAPPI